MSKEEIQRALFGKVGRRREKVGPEASVLKAVLDFVSYHDRDHLVAWRQNTGAAKFMSPTGVSYFVRFGHPGMGDIAGILHSIYMEVEVKAKGMKPTDLQLAWQAQIRRLGAIAFWCDSLDSFIEQLKDEYDRRGFAWPGQR